MRVRAPKHAFVTDSINEIRVWCVNEETSSVHRGNEVKEKHEEIKSPLASRVDATINPLSMHLSIIFG